MYKHIDSHPRHRRTACSKATISHMCTDRQTDILFHSHPPPIFLPLFRLDKKWIHSVPLLWLTSQRLSRPLGRSKLNWAELNQPASFSSTFLSIPCIVVTCSGCREIFGTSYLRALWKSSSPSSSLFSVSLSFFVSYFSFFFSSFFLSSDQLEDRGS